MFVSWQADFIRDWRQHHVEAQGLDFDSSLQC